MSLSKLNHDCFLAVLESTSLSRQLALRLVSTSWCTAIESQLHRQQSLALLCHNQPDISGWCNNLPNGIPNNGKHSLTVKHYSFLNLVTLLLIRLFPSVKHLLLSLVPEEIELTSLYLTALSTSLSSLSIPYSWGIEWPQLAGMFSLKRLFVDKFTTYLEKITKDSPGVSKVMNRMEYFATESLSLDVMHYMGHNLKWLKIKGLECYRAHGSDCQNLLEAFWPLPKPTRDRLEHLSIGEVITAYDRYATDKVSILQSLLRTTPNLKSFHFFDNKIPLKVLASKIVALQNLKELAVSSSAFRKATKEGFDIHQCHLSSVKIVCVLDNDYRDYTRKMSQLRYNRIY